MCNALMRRRRSAVLNLKPRLCLHPVSMNPFLQDLDPEARSLFVTGGSGVHKLVPPPAERRRAFFQPLANTLAFPIAPRPHRRQRRAPPPPVQRHIYLNPLPSSHHALCSSLKICRTLAPYPSGAHIVSIPGSSL